MCHQTKSHFRQLNYHDVMRNLFLIFTFLFRLTLIIRISECNHTIVTHIVYLITFLCSLCATSHFSSDSNLPLVVCAPMLMSLLRGFEIRTVNAIIKNSTVVFTPMKLHKCKCIERFEDVHKREKEKEIFFFICSYATNLIFSSFLCVSFVFSFTKWNIFVQICYFLRMLSARKL